MKSELKKTIYYYSYTDDLVTNKGQTSQLPNNYKWLHHNIFYRGFGFIIFVIARFIGVCYCKLCLHVTVKNKQILKNYRKQGIFLYGNHTQAVGDVFVPMLIAYPKRSFTVASAANLGVPVVGKIINFGGIVIPDTIRQMRYFNQAIIQRINENHPIVIFPEAHVWPYYTKIRPFTDTSFHYPVQNNVPSFCMTTTYQKRKHGNKPKITVYVDGPFLPDETLAKKARQKKLCADIYDCMVDRTKNNTYEYIKYQSQ